MTGHARLTLFAAIGVLVGMLTLAMNAPAIYNTFCRVTGFGGTTQIATQKPEAVLDRTVRIRFDANTGRGAGLIFKPVDHIQELRLGEMGMAFFEVSNPTGQPIVGEAGYNVAPHKAGPYFTKLECFCFEEQVFAPGEKIDLPVIYFIDPAMDEHRTLDDVTEITLSYTFYGDEEAAAAQTAALNAHVTKQN